MENFRAFITQLRSRQSERVAVLSVSSVFLVVNFDLFMASISLVTSIVVVAATTVSILAFVCPTGMCREAFCRLGRRLENGDIEEALDRAATKAERAADRMRGRPRP
jgi:hypothetical protein